MRDVLDRLLESSQSKNLSVPGWEVISEIKKLRAQLAAAVPLGFVVVPREPTDAMLKACLQAAINFLNETKTTEVHPGQSYPSPSENARRCWAAMLAAAEHEFHGGPHNDESISNPSNPSTERHS